VKSLWNELRPLLACVAAFSLFINLLFLIPALFTMQVFDRVIPSNSLETLVVLIGGTCIALAILLLLDYVRNRLQNVLGNIVEERLSPPVVKAIVAKAARAPHAARSDGIRDVGALRTVFAGNALNALFDAPWAPVYVAVIWMFHPVLGIGAVCCAFVMLALAWLNNRVSRAELELLQREGRRASHYVESSLRNAEVLQALGMTDKLLRRWCLYQEQVTALQNKASHKSASFNALTRFTRQGIQIVMLGLGSYLVLTQQASAGIMIATTVLLGKAVQPIEQLVGSWRMLIDARSAYHRLSQLATEFVTEGTHLTMPCPEGHLTVEGLSFRAPGTEKALLLNISFALAAGEALAIIGPSAAGKSTIARLLTGIWMPNTGSVRLDGADIASWPRNELGPWIGYVPQDVELFDGTVADNIARLGEVESDAVVAAAKRANAHDLILSLPKGYDTPVGEQGARLSPGQRQRIALARALYGNPRLVILDEPNSNLDGLGENALAQALRALRGQGVTAIVITHRPALIAHVDKILVLEAGRIAQFGPAADVMKAMQRQAQAQVQAQAFATEKAA
jgi:PrtD family type I secretion system ABC transporter